jgi:hypothetical protein
MVADITAFHKSLGKELIAVKDRVRNIIKDSQYAEEGRYKEAVLKNVISRFLPNSISVGTGFVITPDREITKQIDIIIYDDSSPVLFKEGDFVIVLAHTVRAIIEVKSKIHDTTKLMEFIKISDSNASKIGSMTTIGRKFFNGLFAYECDLSSDTIKNALNEEFFEHNYPMYKKINNIALGNDKFLHLWRNEVDPLSTRQDVLKYYELVGLSFSYFISNLLETIDSNPIRSEHQSLFYPFDSKEPYLKFSVKPVNPI